MILQWHKDAWQEYCEWQQIDKAVVKRINILIKDAMSNPFDGIGKPEPLKHDLSGLWSRRINDTHRLVYLFKNDILIIVGCKGHYER